MGVNKNKDFLYHATLGHNIKLVNPKYYSNLLGFRKNVSLINLEKTKESLKLVNEFLKGIFSKKNCSMLFVNLNNESSISTRICASRTMQPFLIKNWWSGTFTNVVSQNKIDVMFVMSAKNHNFVLQEAKKLNIPVVAVVDTDFDSNLVTFPIWLNDDSIEIHHELTFLISSMIFKANLINYGLTCKNKIK
jgi:small subunit ribosomal protein S2